MVDKQKLFLYHVCSLASSPAASETRPHTSPCSSTRSSCPRSGHHPRAPAHGPLYLAAGALGGSEGGEEGLTQHLIGLDDSGTAAFASDVQQANFDSMNALVKQISGAAASPGKRWEHEFDLTPKSRGEDRRPQGGARQALGVLRQPRCQVPSSRGSSALKHWRRVDAEKATVFVGSDTAAMQCLRHHFQRLAHGGRAIRGHPVGGRDPHLFHPLICLGSLHHPRPHDEDGPGEVRVSPHHGDHWEYLWTFYGSVCGYRRRAVLSSRRRCSSGSLH